MSDSGAERTVARVTAPSGGVPEPGGPPTPIPSVPARRASSPAAWTAGSSARCSGASKTVKPPLTSSAPSGPTSLSMT